MSWPPELASACSPPAVDLPRFARPEARDVIASPRTVARPSTAIEAGTPGFRSMWIAEAQEEGRRRTALRTSSQAGEDLRCPEAGCLATSADQGSMMDAAPGRPLESRSKGGTNPDPVPQEARSELSRTRPLISRFPPVPALSRGVPGTRGDSLDMHRLTFPSTPKHRPIEPPRRGGARPIAPGPCGCRFGPLRHHLSPEASRRRPGPSSPRRHRPDLRAGHHPGSRSHGDIVVNVPRNESGRPP